MFSVCLLVRELGGVDADDDELVRILLFQLLEVGQDVHAVDAAVRPEIEQHDPPAQFARARAVSVLSQPSPPFSSGARTRLRKGDWAITGLLRRPDAAGKRARSSDTAPRLGMPVAMTEWCV